MSKNVTITARPDDIEWVLRKAAEDAAMYGGYCDHCTRKTYNMPLFGGKSFEECRKVWQERFLSAKRLVEAFGVEYEPTSEAETIYISFPYWKGGKTKIIDVPGIGKVGHRVGSTQDMSKPTPTYYSAVHREACKAAADRVVRAWKKTLCD